MNGRADTIGPTAPTIVQESGSYFPQFSGTIDEARVCSDHEGRILQIPINIDDSDIQLLNVYAPNLPKEHRNVFDNLPEYIKGHTPFIMGGDWNCIENILLDKFGGGIECRTLRPSPLFRSFCRG